MTFLDKSRCKNCKHPIIDISAGKYPRWTHYYLIHDLKTEKDFIKISGGSCRTTATPILEEH